MDIRNIIKEKIILFDGAMGTEVISRGIKYNGPVCDYLNIEDPISLKDIHLSYIKAGADVIETNTFNSNSIVLSKYGKEKDVYLLNISGAEIAREAAKNSNKNVFVAGSVGPLDLSLSLDFKNYLFDDLVSSYRLQIEALFKGGVDFLIFETFHDILNLKAAIFALINIFGRYDNLPAIISFTLDKNGCLLSGHDIESAYYSVMNYDVIAVGLNCWGGAKHLEQFLVRLYNITNHPVFFMPNSDSKNDNCNNECKFENVIKKLCDLKMLNIVGGCCGTGPSHIKLISEIIKDKLPFRVKNKDNFIVSHKTYIDLDKSSLPIIVGERMNILGSREFKKAVEDEDIDKIINIAKSQIDLGAKVLDISFINNENLELYFTNRFFPHISFSIKIPFVIDSTDLSVWKTACGFYGGRIIFSSFSLEQGEEKFRTILDIVKRFGGIIVLSLIGGDGKISLSLDEKMKVFNELLKLIEKYGLKNSEIIIDPLVFPISSLSYKFSARDTILAVKEIKNNYKFKTILGISNVSYGLSQKSRKYLNKKFFELSKEAGLDFAILNPSDIVLKYPDENIEGIAYDILWNGEVNKIKEFENFFKKFNLINDKPVLSNLSLEQKLYSMILKGNGEIEKVIYELLVYNSPIEIINNILMPAMREVGILFNRGEYIITDVLSSASVSKRVFDILNQFIKKKDNKNFKLLIATVNGDVHDIGKNLVKIVFEANGFDVIDLGTQVPSKVIVENIKLYKPNIVGLSGLLVRSLDYMIEVANLMAGENINIPLLVGGSPLSLEFVENKMKKIYSNSFYAPDAVSGVELAIKLINRNL